MTYKSNAQEYWKTEGNSGSSSYFIGTVDSHHLRFFTSNAEKMRLTKEGTFGLGTTLPGRKMHIHGTGSGLAQIGGDPVPPGATESFLLITNTESGSGSWDGLRLGMFGSNAVIGTNDNIGLSIFNNTASMFMSNTGKINFFSGGVYDAKIAIVPLNNNGLFIDNTGLTNGYSLKVKTTDNAVDAVTVYNGSTGKFVVKGGGQVGIGTVSPQSGYMLDVAGKIRSCEVKVSQTSWCDFVFAPDYPLLSLSNLKEFINENRHLPEMPSEAEVLENDGFEISKMTQALLQRAEENTLYIIALEEKNTELQNKLSQQNTELEAKIAALEKKLEEVLSQQ